MRKNLWRRVGERSERSGRLGGWNRELLFYWIFELGLEIVGWAGWYMDLGNF
jgi:hypothetical protein